MFISGLFVFTSFAGKIREPTSGLEPLTCSLRVIGHALQGFARACKSLISKGFSLLRLAQCCTVLRSRWYQSGIKRSAVIRGQWCRKSVNAASPVPPQAGSDSGLDEVPEVRSRSAKATCYVLHLD